MKLDINNLIAYENERVISRYELDYPHSKMQPKDAFVELMKYIWLCHKHKSDQKKSPHDDALQFNCVMHSEMKDIDNMWHTFLLFTRDYQMFCRHFLDGQFFHHEPLSAKNKITKEDYEMELGRYLSYIYDNLGEETVIKWFDANI